MGQHSPRINNQREKLKPYLLGVVVVVFMLGVGFLVIDGEERPNYQVVMTNAERDYIYELEQSTELTLTPQEVLVALDIAETHVQHGHLNGMRIPMANDFRSGIPRIPEDKIDDAVQVLEHYFRYATDKEQ